VRAISSLYSFITTYLNRISGVPVAISARLCMADQVVPSTAASAATAAVASTPTTTATSAASDESMNGLDTSQVHAADRSTSPSSTGADAHASLLHQDEPDSDALSNAIGMSGAFSGHLVVKVAAADVGR
jgi:hypothetical protein